ncbi:MAG: iron ABC transporter permease [Phycisphaeraceae bacterium]|nr:iron ABC transporter permease [Phycisphaeraceae bacterium]
MRSRAWPILIALALLAGLAFWLRLKVGGPLTPGWDPIFEFRLQRAAAGLIVGMGLATAGVLLQCLFRNPLASPELLGMSSGAGVAVMLWQLAAYHAGLGIAQTGMTNIGAGVALPGAVGALGLTYLLSQRRGMVEPVTLILTGVVVGIIAAALISLVQQLLPDRGVAASRLLLGAINDDVQWNGIVFAGIVTLVCAAWAWIRGRALDVASLSDDEARSLGVSLGWLRVELFVLAGVLTSVTFAIAGPVAFVGLVCPHLVRLLIGPGHRSLVIGAALLGGAMVVFADVLVRSIDLGSGRLPISVLTALIGGPVLIWMLRRRAAFGPGS